MKDFVRTKGIDFTVDGKTTVFRGVSFGSWMNIESFMIGLPGCDMQQYQAIREVYGEEKANIFYEKYLNEYITEADIQYLAELGVNLVRLPFSYRYFWKDNDINAEVTDGFRHLDRVIALCKKYGIYTILDMHTAPGGVGKDPHSDCMTGFNYFWDHEVLQNVIITVWGRIAKHYKDEKAVLGYDILNEPTMVDDFGVFNRFNNNTIKEIRKNDPNHIIFVEGLDWGKDFSMLELEDTHQLAFSFHEYPVQVKELIYKDEVWNPGHLHEHLDMIMGTMAKYNVPKWCGETGISINNKGENPWGKPSNDLSLMLHDILRELNERGISWTTWTYKDNNVMGLTRPSDDSDWARFTRTLGVKWKGRDRRKKTLASFEGVKENLGEMDAKTENDVWYILENMIRHVDVRMHLIEELKKTDFEDLLKSVESFRFENCVRSKVIEDGIKAYI